MITISIGKADAICTNKVTLTSGMVNAVQVVFSFSDEWDEFNKVAVFSNGNTSVDVSLDDEESCYIPHEVLTDAGKEVSVGVYGCKGLGDDYVAIPTRKCSLGKIIEGTDPSGEEPTEPTPTAYDELRIIVKDLQENSITKKELDAHVENQENPHKVTAKQVGALKHERIYDFDIFNSINDRYDTIFTYGIHDPAGFKEEYKELAVPPFIGAKILVVMRSGYEIAHFAFTLDGEIYFRNGFPANMEDESEHAPWQKVGEKDLKALKTLIESVDNRTKDMRGGEGDHSLQQTLKHGSLSDFKDNKHLNEYMQLNPNAFVVDENGNILTGAYGAYSVVSNGYGVTVGEQSRASGRRCVAYGDMSSADNTDTFALGQSSHAEGVASTSAGNGSHSEGGRAYAKGTFSHAEGVETNALGDASHSEGAYTTAEGLYTHSEGCNTHAKGDFSHAEGNGAKANGNNSHAEGKGFANNNYTHAEGYNTYATGEYSHAEGGNTTASGQYSHAGGTNTIANGFAQTAIGKYNATESDKLFIVGNGDNESTRSNAFSVKNNGDGYFAGSVEGTSLILKSSTAGSNKRFKITVDDSGAIKATEIK